MNCNESLFDLITAIEAYPFSGVSSTRPMAMHTKNISEDELGMDAGAMLEVPMKPRTCSPEEKPSVSIAGESYEVTVSWKILFVGNDTYKILEELHEYPKHLILRTYSGKGYFIRCEEEGYSFSYSEKDGLMDCELTVHNKNGIQRIM